MHPPHKQRARARDFLTFPLRVLKSIPFEFKAWRVPRVKKTKKRVVGMLE